jgi:hypothetical protein
VEAFSQRAVVATDVARRARRERHATDLPDAGRLVRVAIVVFGVRIDGSHAGFLLVAIACSIMAATFGLLISALGKTPAATRPRRDICRVDSW